MHVFNSDIYSRKKKDIIIKAFFSEKADSDSNFIV